MNTYISKGVFLLFLLGLSCSKDSKNTVPEEKEQGLLSHFDHLYTERELGGKTVGMVHIYSEYPDYHYAIEPKEGFTCVDDVSRAMIMLVKYIEIYGADAERVTQLERMTDFVLALQHQNGYFNNFLWGDLKINTTYQTSVAEFNWWSIRALWALETVYHHLPSATQQEAVAAALDRFLPLIKQQIPLNADTFEHINGLQTPTWLPHGSASDQAAVLVLGLLKTRERTGDPGLDEVLHSLARGITHMQHGGEGQYPYGAFLSFGNLWHAWGNSQAYALLKVGKVLETPEYIETGLTELDYFYPYLLENGFAEALWVEKEADVYREIERNPYPQIAYGIRPMVWACTEAYEQTGKGEYRDRALQLYNWLLGTNDAHIQMFDKEIGRCFDGIVGSNDINRNSGAESTVEALLAHLEIQNLNP